MIERSVKGAQENSHQARSKDAHLCIVHSWKLRGLLSQHDMALDLVSDCGDSERTRHRCSRHWSGRGRVVS
jgi:hypothetical protein